MSNLEFIDFLKKNNIIETITSTILSFKTTEVVDSIVNDLIMPFINRDGDGDGEADIDVLKNKKFTLYGVKINIGSFILTIIKFTIIVYLVFLFQKIFKN